MIGQIVQMITVLLLCSTKFLMGIGLAFIYDYTFLETIVICIIGGMLGVVFFTYAGQAINKLWYYYFPKKDDKVKFNKFKRFLVRLRKKYGLMGIAFLTPIILTVPVGAVIAASLVKDKRRVFTPMLVSLVFWTLLFGGIYHVLGIDINPFH